MATSRCAARQTPVVTRLEATPRGFDARYIVSSLTAQPAVSTKESTAPAARPRTCFKQHKVKLASDHTSCHNPLANQFRLILHIPAYWLMLAIRDTVPRRMPLAWAELATVRQSLLKIGSCAFGRAARLRIHFASACPDAALFHMQAGRAA